jgi:hypothetical protein
MRLRVYFERRYRRFRVKDLFNTNDDVQRHFSLTIPLPGEREPIFKRVHTLSKPYGVKSDYSIEA